MLLVGHDGGAARVSRDGARVECLLSGRAVNGVAVHPDEPALVYLAAEDAVFASEDGGRHWRRALDEPSLSVVVDLDDPQEAYVGTLTGGLYRGTGAGARWSPLGRFAGPVHAVSTHPAAPESVLVAAGPAGVAASADRGLRWEPCGGPALRHAFDVVHHPRRPSVAFVATSRALFRTDDGGRTWASVVEAPLRSLAVAQDGVPVVLCRSNEASVVRLAPARAARATAPAALVDLAAHPDDPDRLYAGGADGAVWTSTDAGMLWRPVTTGLPAVRCVVPYDVP